MTAYISRPEIMSSAVVFWKSAILSVSAWISSVNICTGMTSLSTLLSRTGWGETLESALAMTFSFPFRYSMYEQSLYSHTSSDEIFQGQRQHSTALSLSLSLNTVALSQWGFLMHRQLVCHLETKLHLSLSWMHLTGRHLSFMYQNMHVLVPLWFLSWLVQMLLVVISPMRKQHLYGTVLLVGLSNLLSLGENDWDGSLNQDNLYLLRIYLIPMWSEITTKERTVKSWRQTSHHWKWDN